MKVIVRSKWFIYAWGIILFSACGVSQAQHEQKESMENEVNLVKPDQIKEWILELKNALEKDTDLFVDKIGEMENRVSALPLSPDRAVMHSMLAEMYQTYLSNNRGNIYRRTAISGYVPEDIREWSTNLFEEKTREHLTASLQPARLLQATPTSHYAAIVETGASATELRPTLYDFLAGRATQIQPTTAIYADWLAFRKGENNGKAAVFVELDALRYTYQSDRSEQAQQTYKEALERLLDEYKEKDYSTDIRLALIENMQMRSRQSEKNDSIQGVRYRLLQEGIRLFPDYAKTADLKNILAEMEAPYVRSQIAETAYPGKEIALAVHYLNVPRIRVQFFENPQNVMELTPYQSNPSKERGKLIRELYFNLPTPNTYTPQDTVLSLPAAEMGLYTVVISAADQQIANDHIVGVSRLAAAFRQVGANREVLATDQQSGKPIPNATITYYGGKRRELKVLGTVQTDKDGLAILPANKQKEILAAQASLSGDKASRLTTLYPGYQEDPIERTNTEIALFTDRGLYRPGQTLFFKGIAYQLKKEQPQVVANQKYTVRLQDANGKEIAKKSLTTNAMGSFNGEFVLPRQALTGTFCIFVENTYAHFNVEEYKRPTFAVEIEPIKEEIAFGDQVKIHGKAKTFSGVALQEGKVEWRIVRRPFLYRAYYGSFNQEQVANGTAQLNSDGNFALSFCPEKMPGTFYPVQYYNYEVVATVTDNKGETQEASFTFPVGDTSIALTAELPEKADKATVKVKLQAQLLNGQPTQTKGNYRIVALNAKEQIQQPEYTEGKQVAAGSFASGDTLPNEVFTALPSGAYRLLLEAKDAKGRKVTHQQYVVLYDKNDKRPPVFSTEWLVTQKTSCLPGEEAEWVFGTSFEEAYVLYEVYQGKKRISRQRMVLNNENQTFRLPFKEEYGDGVMVSFTYVKNAQLHITQFPINRTQPDRRLTIRPETFRDRLLPGSKESWKFRITDADSVRVAAEVLAGLYDSSLDKILPFDWYFAPERHFRVEGPLFHLGEGMGETNKFGKIYPEHSSTQPYTFDQLDWQGALQAGSNQNLYRVRGYGGVEMSMKSSAGAPALESLSVTNDMAVAEEEVAYAAAPQAQATTQPAVRTNFNETAFFFPALLTDKEGNVILSFTLPESTTTWKLQVVAHTKDLKYGKETREVITSKPLMVAPALPRYLRQGDRVTLSAMVINQSEKAMRGEVRVEWFDPATEKSLTELPTQTTAFSLAANGQTTARWEVTVPMGKDLVGCRIVADADAGSDGEQHLLPILSNQILVTESTPFYVRQSGEQTIHINQPKNSQPFRMTLEMSGNPIWYAVQALPTLTNPANDNILSWFAAYYANTLATSIAQSNPRIQKVIAQWTAAGGDATTLVSNLEKNEELKNILLEETPWVMEAQNETERKQRLSLLFDLNRATDMRQTAMRQLLEQQREDGGWGWFKGFYPDRTMTLSIMKGMAQLVELSAAQYGQEEKEMQMRALRYLDGTMQKDYEDLLKNKAVKEDILPSPQQLEFLFVRSYYRDIPELGEAREAIRFYTQQAEKQWEKLSLYGKAQTAMLMQRNGKKEVAAAIMAWLRKTVTTDEEMGMYWANNRRGNSFFTTPIEVHTQLMAAFREITPQKEETDRMKQWLLNQKRTQDWESTPATLNAIHALLVNGSNWLDAQNNIRVSWAGKTYNSTEGELATGYVKESLTGSAITPQAQSVRIEKEGDAPAWGAVYNQYFAPIDEVTAQKGVLNVEKKLFVEINDGKERQIRPVSAEKPLKVGDKVIVRLTIRSDREMDYVFLKDLRSGAFEPAAQVSGSTYRDGLWFYQTPKDVSENFYFQRLPKGTFVVEYPVFVARAGQYAGGISTIQCLYAPEFVSHTEGGRIEVRDK